MVRAVRLMLGLLLWLCAAAPAAAGTVRWLGQQTVPELEGSLSLAVDADGALWVGGRRGLSRWDGQQWWRPPGVPPIPVKDLSVDAAGVLWVATERGLGRWAEGRWREVAEWTRVEAERVQLLTRADGLWLSTIGGIRRHDPERGLVTEPGLPEVHWYGLATAATGELLAAGRRGLYRRDAEGGWTGPLGEAELVFQSLDARDGTRWIGGFALHRQAADGRWAPAEDVPDLRFIRVLRELPDGSLWVGTHGNGLHVRGPDGLWRRGEARLDGEMVTAILPDAQGQVWVATEGGELHQFQRGPMAVLERENGLRGRLLSAVTTTADGTLWLNSYGVGLFRVDPDTLRLEAVETPCGAEVRSMLAEGDRLWLGAAMGLCEYHVGRGARLHPLPMQVDRLAADGHGGLWLSSPHELRYWRDGAVLHRHTAGEEGLQGSIQYQLQPMPDGSVWAGGEGGLWRRAPDGRTARLPSRPVHALSAEPAAGADALWALTEGELLLLIGNQIRGRLPVDPRHWLLLTDAAEGLWLIGPEFAERWPHAALIEALSTGGTAPAARRHGRRDGLEPLQNVVIGGPSQAFLADGRQVLAGYGRLLVGRLAALDRVPDPRARIDAVTDRDGVPWTPTTALDPDRAPVRIDYTAPVFRDTAQLRFRHRLLPLEPAWSAPGSARQQVYANLRGGDYRFEVQALPTEGRDPGVAGIAAVDFRIAPRWHEYGAVQLALGVLGLSLLGALVRAWLHFRTQRLLKREQALTLLVEERTRQLAEANRELARLARTDVLTGLANRRGFEEALAEHWVQRRDRHAPLALILLDVDHFKAYNDRYGHPEGDVCLRAVGRVIGERVHREPEILLAARHGGEEFALIVACAPDAARALAERLRTAVAACQRPHAGNPGPGVVTVSLGVADGLGPWPDIDGLIDAADRALYRAKRNGRNRVEVEAPD